MPHASPLPQRLRYLQSFRKKFASRSPEELNENTGEPPLFALLSKRLKGHSEAAAQKILEDDLAALEEWLSVPTQASDCLQFVRGFLLVSPSELAKYILEESAKQAEPLPLLEMSLPEGAKLRRVESRTETGALLRWKGLITSLDVVSSEAAANLAELEGQKGAGDEGVEISVSPVSFGGVKGTKFVRTGDSWFGPFKDVRYVLLVPGGHVHATTSPIGKNVDEAKWDETALEAYFHTLCIVGKQPRLN